METKPEAEMETGMRVVIEGLGSRPLDPKSVNPKPVKPKPLNS